MAIDLYSKATTDSLLSGKYDASNPSGFISDAPVDGSTYGRKDGAWEIVSGGGGLTISTLSNGATSTLNSTAPTAGQALTFDGTDLVWATVGGGSYLPLAGGSMDSTAVINLSDGTSDSQAGGWGYGVELTSDTTQNATIQYNAVSVQNGSGTMTMGPTGLTFPDSTVQTTAATAGSVDQTKADGIAMIITNTPYWNNYIYIVYNSLPAFISQLGSSWGLYEPSSTTYNSYSYASGNQIYFSGSYGGSTVFNVRVNGTDSSFTI